MKKAILALLCIFSITSIFNFGCRKKELDEVDIATKPSHCYNGIKDFDEIVTDGGGICGSNGEEFYTNCHYQRADTVFIGAYKYPVDSCKKKINGGEQTYTVYYKDGNVKFIFSTLVYYNYDLGTVSFGSPAEDEFDCIVTDLHYGTKYPSGGARLTSDGVDFAVELCGGEFYVSGNPKDIDLYTFLN